MKKKADKDKDAKKINFEEIISKNLSEPKLTLDYTGYQYTKLNLSGKGLDALSPVFKDFKYIEHLDVSNNNLSELAPLAMITWLTTLNAQKNNVKDLKFLNVEEGWKNLRTLNLSFNKVSDLIPIAAPVLSSLTIVENKIQKLQAFTGHPKLKVLDLRRNKIGPLQGLANMPELKELYLAENKIRSLAGLEGCPLLAKLHLRKNVIVTFEQAFPLYENLSYLNVRENLIDKLQEINKTKDLPALRQIVFQQNPLITKNQYYLFDVINTNLKLTRINKVQITKSVKLRAFKHAEDKWKAAEAAKKQLEEEQRLKQQAAQKAAAAVDDA